MFAMVALALAFAAAGWAGQCMGTTRDGRQCQNQTSGSYCHFHDPNNTKQCAGRNRDGSSCRNNAQPGRSYCYQH